MQRRMHQAPLQVDRRILDGTPERRDIAFPVPPVTLPMREITTPEVDVFRRERRDFFRIPGELAAELFHEGGIPAPRRSEHLSRFVESPEGREREAALQRREWIRRQTAEYPLELAQRAFVVAGREQ